MPPPTVVSRSFLFSSEPAVASKLEAFARLSADDRAALAEATHNFRYVEPRRDLISEGDKPRFVHLVLDGWACRYKQLPDGKRQIVSLFVPGDFCDINVYILKATPRRGYKAPDRDSEVLTGMEGELWIDQKTYQWVKVEAHVVHPVRIEGFIAEVEPGTMFEVEKRPVAGDIWMASHFAMKSNAKVMLVVPHKGEEDDTYFNYRKATNPSGK